MRSSDLSRRDDKRSAVSRNGEAAGLAAQRQLTTT